MSLIRVQAMPEFRTITFSTTWALYRAGAGRAGSRNAGSRSGRARAARRACAAPRAGSAGAAVPGSRHRFFSPRPEPQVLEERERDHGHQRVPVQTGPGAALEMVEAE